MQRVVQSVLCLALKPYFDFYIGLCFFSKNLSNLLHTCTSFSKSLLRTEMRERAVIAQARLWSFFEHTGMRAVLETGGKVFPNTDRPRLVNNIFIYFSILNYESKIQTHCVVLFILFVWVIKFTFTVIAFLRIHCFL